MGAWGPRLYQDDVALDAKDSYKDQLRKGRNGKEITQELIKNNEYTISDCDDAPVFWFALADTQWNLGRLEEFVKEQALHHIHAGEDLKRWELEDPKGAKIRMKVLLELEQKLLSSQPAEKKVPQHRIYRCEWKMGDVFAYPLASDYAKEKGIYGKYFLFHKIDELMIWDENVIPIVRVKITEDTTLPKSKEDFDALEYVQTGFTRYEDRFLPYSMARPLEEQIAERDKIIYEVNERGLLTKYKLQLLNTSKRAIPKSLIYVGNFQNVLPPPKEFTPRDLRSVPGYMWKSFDEIFIGRYCSNNTGSTSHSR